MRFGRALRRHIATIPLGFAFQTLIPKRCRTCCVHGAVYAVVEAHRSMQACRDGSKGVNLFAAQCGWYILEGEQKQR